MRKRIFALLSVLALSLVILAGCKSRESAEEPSTEPSKEPSTEPTKEPSKEIEPEIARKAPDFTLNSFDGNTISLSNYKGKIVVLEWFSLECPFVIRHYGGKPTMINLANKYRDRNVVWFAVNSTGHTTPEANTEFAKKYKLPYPILDDRSGKVGRAYGAKTTPHMYVIDTRGSITYQGAIDNDKRGRRRQGVINYVDKALAELTGDKEVTTTDTMSYGRDVMYAR
ncbi:MAG: redoxin domain-containing protein [Phycisphaerae bacterium]|nr:redoxin domain-containing protein [Phycisphaerae bacterium]NIP55363.1 redoxin domain-containing protein [Phycisphaerae bacterium]NIS54132.1 redoxin domain-containing protein [Phycisphaerae bacterium]NIU11684.1 redoxin domain-containing protein [Phycisphaerae bacterium]NIU59506.1 redoxin domain-containing protein [Phycisphaerae bacterium]